MPNKTFKDFNTKSPLSDTDYIIGYKSDGTEEFRTTLGGLVNYLKTYFVPKTMLAGLRVNWDDTFNIVNHLSSDWDTASNTTFLNQNNWNAAYTITKSTSSVYNTVNTLSTNWNSAYTATRSSDSVYNTVKALSANWQDAYSLTRTSAGVYNIVKTLSGNWNNAYTVTNSFSADWQAAANLPPATMNHVCNPCSTVTANIDRFWKCISTKDLNELQAGCTSDGKILINNTGIDTGVWTSTFNNPNEKFSSVWSDIKIAESSTNKVTVALSEFNKDGVVYITNNAGLNWYTSGTSKNRNWMNRGLLVSSSGDKIIALEKDGTLHRLNAGTEINPGNNDSNWQIISNTPFHFSNGYYPTSIASTSDLNTIYVTAETPTSSAIFKSVNFGSTWTQTNAVTNLFWRSVAVGKQSGTDTVWAVPFSNSSKQLYLSMDGGNSWSLNGPSEFWHSVVSLDSRIVALTRINNRMHVSTNNGNSWTTSTAPTTKQWNSVAITRISNSTIYATQEGGRLFRTINNGVNWSELI